MGAGRGRREQESGGFGVSSRRVDANMSSKFLAWEKKLPGRLERYGFKALMPASNG